MKKKLVYIALAFGIAAGASISPAFATKASASCTEFITCPSPR